ncbi:MAG: hypothetical protein ABI386_00910 [Rhodanobacter sp.]
MTGLVGARLAGCALVAFIGGSTASAAAGRISFSGAVVEPTCGGEAIPTPLPANTADEPAVVRLDCGRTATDPGRSYLRTITNLSRAQLAHDPLLAYFTSYTHSGDAGQSGARVVVDTYD